MYLPSVSGLVNILKRRPKLLAAARANLVGQVQHRLKNGRHNGMSPPPEQLTIVVTDICNLRCQMCQYAHSDTPSYQLNRVGHMKTALYHKLIDEMKGTPLVSFTGGEPLLHPKIHEFIAYAHTKGHVTTLTTNGWLLAEQAQDLCDAGLDILVVSVDGPHDVHNRIRGGFVFEKLGEGIKTIMKLPRRPVVFVTMAMSDLNYDQLDAVYELALAWGVDGLNYNHLWMQTEEMVAACMQQYGASFAADHISWDINPEFVGVLTLSESLESIQKRSRRQRLLVTETPFLSPRQRAIWYQDPAHFIKWTKTRCAWIRMKVWPDGGVKACRDYLVGNVQTNHVMEVWNGKKMRGFRHFLDKQGVMPICARCCYMAHR